MQLPVATDHHPRSSSPVHLLQVSLDGLVLDGTLLKAVLGTHDNEICSPMAEGIPKGRDNKVTYCSFFQSYATMN